MRDSPTVITVVLPEAAVDAEAKSLSFVGDFVQYNEQNRLILCCMLNKNRYFCAL